MNKYGCLQKCKNIQLVYCFMAIVYNWLNARVSHTIELLYESVDKLYTIASYIYGQQYKIVSLFVGNTIHSFNPFVGNSGTSLLAFAGNNILLFNASLVKSAQLQSCLSDQKYIQ